MGEPLIVLQDVSKRLARQTILHQVSCRINKGDVVAIMGPSGAGKSTFLRCINGLVRIDDGDIRIHGSSIVSMPTRLIATTHKVGMVFQQFCLFANLTVLENITLGPIVHETVSRTDAIALGKQLLQQVGLQDKQDVYPSKLSGGQKQRVAIARTLAMKPDILLFDEPTSALDPAMVNEVQEVIAKLAQTGLTILLVSHEVAFAKSIASRVLFFSHGQLQEDKPAPLFFTTPSTAAAQAFLQAAGQVISQP